MNELKKEEFGKTFFTKGEWMPNFTGSNQERESYYVVHCQNLQIAKFSSLENSWSDAEAGGRNSAVANVNLVCAAPKMYEMLAYILDYFGGGENGVHQKMTGELFGKIIDLLNEANEGKKLKAV